MSEDQDAAKDQNVLFRKVYEPRQHNHAYSQGPDNLENDGPKMNIKLPPKAHYYKLYED